MGQALSLTERALWRAPFCRLLLCLWLGVTQGAWATPPDTPFVAVKAGDFALVREALVEAIEAEGLVVSAVIPFGKMLARTAEALDQQDEVFRQAEIVQFCSSRLAWALVKEAPAQLALCPLSITLYATPEAPGQVFFSYRTPGRATPGRASADDLLRKLVERAVELAW